MGLNNNTYDLILLYVFHRVHNYYLNIIKYLSNNLSIGIVEESSVADTKTRKKIANTERVFLDLCRQLGADILDPKKKYSCNLLLAPQHSYTYSSAENISRNKIIALHRFGSGAAGLDQLKKMGVVKMWVYERKLLTDMLLHEKRDELIKEFEIIEMGTPYARYPAFDFSQLNIDYMIAFPTPMLIRTPPTKLRLLGNISTLINSIPNSNTICMKRHNVVDGGYVLGKSRLHEIFCLCPIGFLSKIVCSTVSKIPDRQFKWIIPNILYEFSVKTLEETIKSKTIMLSVLSDKYNFGIEHFIPFIKEGVITGISSCIWHSLYNNLAVYNCDDRLLWKEMPNYAVYKNFHVSPCHGKLNFNSSYMTKVSESSRKADLIKMIQDEL